MKNLEHKKLRIARTAMPDDSVQSPIIFGNKEINRVQEVDFIRPFLILAVVIYHSFAVYDGKWPPFENFSGNQCYVYISRMLSFRLESLVFISGFVWGFLYFVKNKKQSFVELLRSKAKRLLIPSILFSVLYKVLIGSKTDVWHTFFVGEAHLWFLPMLFSCFLLGYAFMKIPMKELNKILILLFFSFLSFLPIGFNISKVAYFLMFFYVGFALNKYLINGGGRILSYSEGIKSIAFLWIINILLWILIELYIEQFFCHKVWYHLLLKLFQIVYSFTGISALFLTSRYFIMKYGLPHISIVLCSYCYGVYICHQFVLQLLYYKTSAPVLLGPRVLPWVGLFVALIVSLFFTYLFRLSKLGRFLIG